MKISKIIKKVVKQDGKDSLAYKTIVKLKDSKEFNYLIDASRA